MISLATAYARRPLPPTELFDLEGLSFVAAPEVEAWTRQTFIAEEGWLENEDHAHLRRATIGVLWTSVPNQRAMRSIIGQAEIGEPSASRGKWAKARAEQQIVAWFGDVPDFILTFDASYAAVCGDPEWCALVEHELYHCAQARDGFGMPKFTKEGQPIFAMRGHDVEEFVGVVRRYGADVAGVTELIQAAKEGPIIDAAQIAGACGTCHLRLVA